MKARRPWKTPPKVFLADGAPTIATQLAGWAAAPGGPFSLRVFSTARQLLRRMEYERPDILLLDVAFPGFDGLTALRLLRSEQTPVILLSPDTVEGARLTIQAILAGGADYLIKRGRGRQLHLAISRPRLAAMLHRMLAAQAQAMGVGHETVGRGHWLPLDFRGEVLTVATEEPAPLEGDGDWFGLVCSEPHHIGRVISGFTHVPERPDGSMLLCVPQALRFGRAFRDAVARRWNRVILDLESDDQLRPGQWRILPGRALLNGGARPPLKTGGALVPNRMVDVRRALACQLDLLNDLPAGSLRLFLTAAPGGALLTSVRALLHKRHVVYLHPTAFPALSCAGAPLTGESFDAWGEQVA